MKKTKSLKVFVIHILKAKREIRPLENVIRVIDTLKSFGGNR